LKVAKLAAFDASTGFVICGARVTEGGVNSFDWKSQVLGGKTHWMNVKPGRIKGLNNTNGLFSAQT
jgi:hypothetical protein